MATKEIKSIQRCFEILSAFRNAKSPKLDASQISRITNIPLSSLYRYLQTLITQMVLNYDADTKKFTLGPLYSRSDQ
jgi:DNA-binding IclR family transcriptional regulator